MKHFLQETLTTHACLFTIMGAAVLGALLSKVPQRNSGCFKVKVVSDLITVEIDLFEMCKINHLGLVPNACCIRLDPNLL